MEPDYDITLNSSDGESSDATKSHFLNSLGLGERDSDVEALRGGRQRVEDEGVVLSSLPDDLGFSMVPSEPARGLSLSFSVTRGTDCGVPSAISLPSDEEPEPEPESAVSECSVPDCKDTPESEPVASDSKDPEAILHLACPECDGALVLKRRHLGVEGACVWCHTAIVAAESGRDGAVRIFPILGVRVPTPDDATKTELAQPEARTASESADHPTPAMEEPTSWTEPELAVAPAPGRPEATNEPVASITGEVEPTVPSGFAPSTMDLAGEAMDDFSPEGSPAVFETESDAVEDGIIANDPPDLDSLYETGGFVAPLASPPAPTNGTSPFVTKEIPSSGFETVAAIPAGFGSFLQSAKPLPESEPSADFPGPTPWGPPVRPAVTAPASPKSTTQAIPEPDDAPPSALPEGFAPSIPAPAPSESPTWETAFGRPSATAPVQISGADDSFAAAFGSPFGTGSADTEKESSPFTGFSAGMSPAVSAAAPIEEPQTGFLSPANAFSTGSSSWSEPAPAGGGLFGGPDHPGQLPWGSSPVTPADEAPATLTPSNPDPGFATEPEATFTTDPVGPVNPFGEVQPPSGVTPFSSLVQAPAPIQAALPVPVAGQTLLPPSLPAAPVLPTHSATSPIATNPPVASNEPATAPTPQVTSLPLGAKPKPKVRKGFIVLMVVILGFASGAALASFVLPVERYVEAARAFMEAKFAPKAAVPVMPQLNDLTTAPGTVLENSRPTDLQP